MTLTVLSSSGGKCRPYLIKISKYLLSETKKSRIFLALLLICLMLLVIWALFSILLRILLTMLKMVFVGNRRLYANL